MQADISAAFELGKSFFDLPGAAKEKTKFIPKDYVGWRSLSELEAMSGQLRDLTSRSSLQSNTC